MAAIKSHTDIEQSKKLAEILPPESADMYYHFNRNAVKDYFNDIPNFIQLYNHFVLFYDDIPCWSLAALLSILDFPALTQEKDDEWEVCVCDYDNDGYIEEITSNPVDACYEMIIKLKEKNLL